MKQLGNDFYWVLNRAIALVFSVGSAVSAVLAMALNPIFWVVAFAALISVVFMYPVARAEFDESGIIFQRWFKKHFVRWDDVRSFRYSPWFPELQLNLHQRVAGSRRVWLSGLTQAATFSEILGRKEPAIVTELRKTVHEERVRSSFRAD